MEIKFIKGEKFKKIKQSKNHKFGLKNLERYIKIEKKFCNLMVESNQKSNGRLSR